MFDAFKNLSVQLRVVEARKFKFCLNCLNPNHLVKDCRSSTYKHYNKKHHSLLHYNISDNVNKSKNEKRIDPEKKPSDNAATLNFITSDLLNKLGLETERIVDKVIRFRGNTTQIKGYLQLLSQSYVSTQNLRFIMIDQITSKLPENRIEINQL